MSIHELYPLLLVQLIGVLIYYMGDQLGRVFAIRGDGIVINWDRNRDRLVVQYIPSQF